MQLKKTYITGGVFVQSFQIDSLAKAIIFNGGATEISIVVLAVSKITMAVDCIRENSK